MLLSEQNMREYDKRLGEEKSRIDYRLIDKLKSEIDDLLNYATKNDEASYDNLYSEKEQKNFEREARETWKKYNKKVDELRKLTANM